MKRPEARDEQDRFKGQLRHYHRTGPSVQQPWSQWTEGQKKPFQPPIKWLKIIWIILSLLAIGGIVAGLILELG